MKLPWPSRDPVAPAVAGFEPGGAARPPVSTFTSPGLEAAFTGLPERRSCRVLELGPAVADNVAFVAESARCLEVVDIGRLRAGERVAAGQAIERDLPLLHDLLAERSGSFHLVLAWDLFNYLARPRLPEVVRLLSQLCAPRGRLLATIFEGETMPLRPSRYRIVGPKRLMSEALTSDVTGAPRLPPVEVERAFEGFRIERSFVLRHGAREYLATSSS